MKQKAILLLGLSTKNSHKPVMIKKMKRKESKILQVSLLLVKELTEALIRVALSEVTPYKVPLKRGEEDQLLSQRRETEVKFLQKKWRKYNMLAKEISRGEEMISTMCFSMPLLM